MPRRDRRRGEIIRAEMRILVLRSRKRTGGDQSIVDRAPGGQAEPENEYTQEFASAYAEKVIGNLVGEQGFCASCGPDCNACREPYDRRFGQNIVGVIALPPVLPYLLEQPEQHVPREIPPHEILLAVHVHEQILVEVLKRLRRRGTRGVVVPVEDGDWLSGSARAEAESICRDAGIEVSFPKPFCDFDPPPGSVLAEFRRRFHIGKPHVELAVRGGKIQRAHVNVSAACGATYYVARWLEGRRLDDDLKYEVVAKRMHSYPCTASMKWDDELGDTIMHVASQAHYEILSPLAREATTEPEMVMSPVGLMLPKPVPARENIQNVERAKEAILEDLATGRPVSLESLRSQRRITPAAAYTAMLVLKQEGKIRTEGGMIVKA